MQEKPALQPDSSRCGDMQIRIEMPSGNILALLVHAPDTVSNVKAKISDKTHISPEAQHLVLAGKPLQNDRTLAEYNVRPQSSLQLLLRLRGGMKIDVPTLKGKITVDLRDELDLKCEIIRTNSEHSCQRSTRFTIHPY